MRTLKKIFLTLFNRSSREKAFSVLGLYTWMDDERFVKKIFRNTLGYELNLENPVTYNEKLQWLKLYDRNPEYTKMVDKNAVKKYVSNKIGEEYIIPTLGVWNDFDEIDFSKLPNQFVLKCTHDSGGLVICRDKNKLNLKKAKKKINKSLKRDYYKIWREWPYKDVPHQIIAEKYMVDESGYELKDYKFFVMDGVVRALFVASDRQAKSGVCFDFYDRDFKHLPIVNGHPNAEKLIQKPQNFDEMVKLAEILAKDAPQMRVDFYNVNGKIYFGEITFFHFGGIVPFEPAEWDKKFGEWITLPEIRESK